ncbi:hypothetical protein EJB05_15696, partial [Eragrostis curvula]
MRRTEQGKLCILYEKIVEKGDPSVLELTEAIASLEIKARRCYEGGVQMERDAFCKMLLLDAVQVTSLLNYLGQGEVQTAGAVAVEQSSSSSSRENKEATGPSTAPATASNGAAQGSIIKCRNIRMTVHDLIMLENQIPFFVVEKVYKLRYCTEATAAAWGTINNIITGSPTTYMCHLIFISLLLLNCRDDGAQNSTKCEYGRFRRATEYYEAGVKFRLWSSDEGSASAQRPFLDVAFSDGVLRMSLQIIDEKTGYILRNVLAYEQKYYQTVTSPGECYVTAYVVFMSQILSGPEDVALLARRGIMKHHLGNDEEVCTLFRGLTSGLIFDPDREHYLKTLGVALQGHCRSRLHRWRAWIVRHRFSNPWLVAAWVFGAAAVLGTIVQTVYAVLSYYHAGNEVLACSVSN